MNDLKPPQVDFKLNNHCALCGRRLMEMGVTVIVYPETPDEQDVAMCTDSLGCRRRTYSLIKRGVFDAAHDLSSNG